MILQVWRRCVIGESWRFLCQSPCVTKVCFTTAAVPRPGSVRILVGNVAELLSHIKKTPSSSQPWPHDMHGSDLKIPTYTPWRPVFKLYTSRMMANQTAHPTMSHHLTSIPMRNIKLESSNWSMLRQTYVSSICDFKMLGTNKKQKHFYRWPSADLYPPDRKRNTSKL